MPNIFKKIIIIALVPHTQNSTHNTDIQTITKIKTSQHIYKK